MFSEGSDFLEGVCGRSVCPNMNIDTKHGTRASSHLSSQWIDRSIVHSFVRSFVPVFLSIAVDTSVHYLWPRVNVTLLFNCL